MGAGTFILAAGYAKSATIAVTCMCIGVASSGLMHSGYNVNMLDIAPRYACVIMGITNTVGTITGFLSPMMVGFITVNKVSLISLQTKFCHREIINITLLLVSHSARPVPPTIERFSFAFTANVKRQTAGCCLS